MLRRFEFDRDALLAQAYRRVLAAREVRSALGPDGCLHQELGSCLQAAYRCVRSLCAPQGGVLEVDARCAGDAVVLGGRVVVHNPRLREQAVPDGKATLYLLSCGYDSREALKRLDGDYATYHLQNMIAAELLYGIGRQLHAQVCRGAPQIRFARYAVKMPATQREAAGMLPLLPGNWDPATVHALLELFGDERLGVSLTGAGCFVPLHSLLGVMTATPAPASAGKPASAVTTPAAAAAVVPGAAVFDRRQPAAQIC